MVFGTWTTRNRPPAICSSLRAEKAVSSPPIVINPDRFSFSNAARVFSKWAAFLVGFARAIPDRTPLEMDTTHFLNGKLLHFRRVALHDPFEAVQDADDRIRLEYCGSWPRRSRC